MDRNFEYINYNSNDAVMVVDRSELGYSDMGNITYRQTPVKDGQPVHLARWGDLDRFPLKVKNLLTNDSHALQIIRKKVSFLLGAGLFTYKTKTENDKAINYQVFDKDFEKWYKKYDVEINELLTSVAHNLEWFDNYLVEFNMGRLMDRIVKFESIDANYYRAVQIPKGQKKVSEYVISRNRNTYESDEMDLLPVFDWENPRKHANFVLCGKTYEPGSSYYSTPPWYGSKKELDLSTLIIDTQIEGLKSGFNIKYQLEIDQQFYHGCNDPNEKRAKKAKLVSELRALFSKNKNNNMLVTEQYSNIQGKQIAGVKINKIDNKIIDASFTKLLELKQNARPAAFGIDPALAGFETNSNFASGSEIKNKYQLHQQLNTRQSRDLILNVMKVFKCVNGWDEDLKFGFKDVKIKGITD